MAPTKDGRDGPGMSIEDLAACFYANNDLVTPTQTKRTQRAFAVLTSIFYRVGLRKNKMKTVSMAYQLCHVPGHMS